MSLFRLLLLCSAIPCFASSIGPAGDYNLFVFGDASRTNSDVEGKTAIGGNLYTSSMGYNSKGSASDTDALLVQGNISGDNSRLINGDLRFGGTRAVNTPWVAGATAQGGIPDGFFSSAKNYYDNISTYYGALPTSGLTTYYSWGGIELNAGASDLPGTSMQVFTVSGSSLASANTLTINAPNKTTVIVNVTGANPSLQSMGFFLNGVSRNNVLFNFYQAATLTASGVGVQGSVLAPRALLVADNGQFNGQVIVNSMVGSGEIHRYLYTGYVPTPEPSTYVMGAAGLAFILIFRRKRDAEGRTASPKYPHVGGIIGRKISQVL